MNTSVTDSTIVAWKDPSLTFFHEGQVYARDGDFRKAHVSFKKALKISRKLRPGLDLNYDDWICYIQGTIAYIDNDLEVLRSHAKNIKMNYEILVKLVGGLEEFGFPDYARDFGGW